MNSKGTPRNFLQPFTLRHPLGRGSYIPALPTLALLVLRCRADFCIKWKNEKLPPSPPTPGKSTGKSHLLLEKKMFTKQHCDVPHPPVDPLAQHRHTWIFLCCTKIKTHRVLLPKHFKSWQHFWCSLSFQTNMWHTSVAICFALQPELIITSGV